MIFSLFWLYATNATIYPIYYIGMRHAYNDWWNFVSSSHTSMEDDWNKERYIPNIPSGWRVIGISQFDVYLTWFNRLTKFMDAVFFCFQLCAINFVMDYPYKLPIFIKSPTKIWKRRPWCKWCSFRQQDIGRCLVRFRECILRLPQALPNNNNNNNNNNSSPFGIF